MDVDVLNKFVHLQRDFDSLRNDYNKLRYHVDQMEKRVSDSILKNNELQGKVATLAGRLHG